MESTKLGRTNRRTWLVAIGAALGALPVLHSLRVYLTPDGQDHGHTVALGPIDSVLPDGKHKQIMIDGTAVLLSRVGADITALDLTCTHASCPLKVDLNIKRILCACHGGAFDLNGTAVKAPPNQPLRRFETRITNGELFLRIPARGSA